MLATTISLANIGSVTNEYISHNLQILKKCENKQFVKNNTDLIKDASENLKSSNNDFNANVIEYTMQKAPEWLKENPEEIKSFVKLLISHLDSKISSYDRMEKIFNRIDKTKLYKNDLKELVSKTKEMKSDILHLSKMIVVSQDAREIYTLLNSDLAAQESTIVLEDYWHNINMEEEYKVLFVKVKESDNFDDETILTLENNFNEVLAKFKSDKKKTVASINFGSKSSREFVGDSKFSFIAIA